MKVNPVLDQVFEPYSTLLRRTSELLRWSHGLAWFLPRGTLSILGKPSSDQTIVFLCPRFILPVLPLVMIYAGHALATLELGSTPNAWRVTQNDQSRSLSPPSRPESYVHPSNEQPEPQLLQTEACGPLLRNRKKPKPSAKAQTPLETLLETTAAKPSNPSTGTLNPSLTLSGTIAAEASNPSTEVQNPAKQPPLATTAAKPSIPSTEAPNPAKPPLATTAGKPLPKAFLASLIFLVLTQVPMALYFSLVHQRGAVKVMEYLAGKAQGGRVLGVWFLMPCHSTPFYSHLHAPVPMRTLDCSPRCCFAHYPYFLLVPPILFCSP
jgi:hypothetical protein